MNIEKARYNMIEQQIRTWNVFDPTVLNLMASIPREIFVPPEQKSMAFADLSISLPHKQQMYTPREEARMLQSLELKPDDKVLEIGTGTGFTGALIASIAKKLVTVDCFVDFITLADQHFRRMSLKNVIAEIIDISEGWHPSEHFDAIVITPAIKFPPKELVAQLKPEGRLFCIEGEPNNQYAKLYRFGANQELTSKFLFEINTPQVVQAQTEKSFVF
ncbi:protein-L-isoaspartate O-methyltransferase family protein [Pleionea sediminis]|uniref:protein-L-isoaspartate O-methyltransferase family protein n=1 Tax=Pleionea sediminis TaxID=2569479 RepID=UPI001184F7DD|nr:protein-L-isoaspartate O-methyltransferase [Pleionea sediminis]